MLKQSYGEKLSSLQRAWGQEPLQLQTPQRGASSCASFQRGPVTGVGRPCAGGVRRAMEAEQ